MSNFAWVTLATNDSYSLGALVVAYSLKRVHTAHQLAVLITPGVTESMRNKLNTVFDVVQEVNLLDSQDASNLALLQRPELGITFTKLHCWCLTQFQKCVFLDADTLVIQNCDELFEREELSAAPDVGWPDCFNSGVFVYKPSMDTHASILSFAVKHGSFDGGDQGLLNQYFSDWAHKDISKHLPFTYNTSSVATYSYIPAFKQFGENVKILHFIGTAKPWLQNFNSETKTVHVPGGFNHLAKFLQYWWDLFCEEVHPRLSADMSAQLLQTEEQSRRNVVGVVGNIPAQITQIIYYNADRDSFDNRAYVDPWEDYLKQKNENEEKENNAQEHQHHNHHQHDDGACYENGNENNDNNYRESCNEPTDFVQNVHVEPCSNNLSGSEESTQACGIAGALSKLTLGEPKSTEQAEYEEHMRRQYWESGTMDYMGRDSFSNIWARIQHTINGGSKGEASAAVVAPVPQQHEPRGSPKSRSRSSTPRRDMRDRSPTPQPDEVLPVDKKEVVVEPAIQEEEAQDNNNDENSPPLVHYDPTTNTTTLTKKVFAGYQQIITTKTPEGKIKTQTKTFIDPAAEEEECKTDDDVEQLMDKNDKLHVEVVEETPISVDIMAVLAAATEVEEDFEIISPPSPHICETLSEESLVEAPAEKTNISESVVAKPVEIELKSAIVEDPIVLVKNVEFVEENKIEIEEPFVMVEEEKIAPQIIEEKVSFVEEPVIEKAPEPLIESTPIEAATVSTLDTVEPLKNIEKPILEEEPEIEHIPRPTRRDTSKPKPPQVPEPVTQVLEPQPQVQVQPHETIAENKGMYKAASEALEDYITNSDLMVKILEVQKTLLYLREKMTALECFFKSTRTKAIEPERPEPKVDLDVILSGFPRNFDVDLVVINLNGIYGFGLNNLSNKFKLILDKKASDSKIYMLVLSFKSFAAKTKFLTDINEIGAPKFTSLIDGLDDHDTSVICVNERLNDHNLDLKKHIQSLVNVIANE